ncbi:MAG TPA: ATP-binding protein [Pseudomonadales bacterium]|nr:ATP-binding protein [Pseudomonadales bacterium]
MAEIQASFTPSNTQREMRQFVSDVNWYIFLVTLAVFSFVVFQYFQGKADIGRLIFVSFHPVITFVTYRWSLSKDPAAAQFSHRAFCFYLVFAWNTTFIMNGGFASPTSVWLILAPLFVVTVLGQKAAMYTVLISAINMLVVFLSKQLFNIEIKINDTVDAFTLGLFHIPAALILAFFTMRRYSAANQSALAAQQKLLNSQQHFLSNMSHELRTPINGIYGVLQLIEKNIDDPYNKNLIHAAEVSTQTLTNIINDILHMHQIEKGMLELDEHWSDSRQIFANVRGLFVPSAQLKNIIFNVRVCDSVPDELFCDALRLAQVINNITGNAIKFTQQGYVKVLAKYADDHLIITVSDTGIGMDEAALFHVFDRFSQADNSAARRFGGLGLGLSISHELISLMEGEIKAISSLNQGTTVTISVPLPARSSKQAERATQRDLPQIDLAAMHVLLVDDNLTNQLTTRLLLERYVEKVGVANHGKQALEMLTNNTYHVVITDINMPQMDGTELLASLRESGNNIAVIAMTGISGEDSVAELEAVGFNGLIEKPVEEAALLRAILEATT